MLLVCLLEPNKELKSPGKVLLLCPLELKSSSQLTHREGRQKKGHDKESNVSQGQARHRRGAVSQPGERKDGWMR